MYINNDLCPYKIRNAENVCGRIFRPWDNAIAKNVLKDTSQDCTVSTTTQDEEELVSRIEEKCDDKSSTAEEKSCNLDKDGCKNESRSIIPGHSASPVCKNSKIGANQSIVPTSPLYPKLCESLPPTPEIFMPTNPLPVDFLQDPYSTINTDLVQTNLAHHLGLPPNDPLLLESLAQGYALEEYARVLSQEQQAKLMAAKKQRPKKYKCPHCDVGFSNNGQLKGHIRIHTGERPFKCDEKDCGKTFTRNEELTRHKRIHSGLRPFPCNHCGKRFGRKDHLKKHSRTHFQPRGLYAVPVVLPFEAWASGQTNGYPFFPVMY